MKKVVPIKAKEDNKVVIDGKLADLLKKKGEDISEAELKVLNLAIKWEAVKAKLDDDSWGAGLLNEGTDET